MMQKVRNAFLLVLVLFMVGGLGVVAVLTAQRMNQTKPVAPTVPQIKPKAAEPERNPACTLTFNVVTPPAELRCDYITMTPNQTRVYNPLETRTLVAIASGGWGVTRYKWTLDSNGWNNGTLSSGTEKTVVWTGPSALPADQNWTIRLTVMDEKRNEATSDNCVVNLSYGTVHTCNGNCVVSSECPSGMGCVGGKCRNTTCPDQANCTCVTPACNTSCTTASNCPTNLTCASGACRNPSCTDQTNCVCPVTPPPPPPPPAAACNTSCSSSGDCPSNLACSGGRCRNSACTDRTNCVCLASPSAQPTHTECRNKACVTVNGAGKDMCTSDVSCQPVAKPPVTPEPGGPLETFLMIAAGIILIGGAFLLAL